jgi:hypothetical protein
MIRLKAWRCVTLCRHRSELRALDFALKWKPLAIFPIFVTVGCWWFALCLPASLPGVIGLVLWQSADPVWRLLGGSLYVPAAIYALVVLCFATPSFFRWYLVAVSLMLGSQAMADRKRAEIIAAMAGEEGTGGSG